MLNQDQSAGRAVPMQRAVDAIASRLRQHRAALAALTATGIKATGAVLNIVVFTLAARALSADEFGHLAVWFNVISFLAVAAVSGQETLIVRSWSEYTGRGEHSMARAAYWFGWRGVARTALPLAAGLLSVCYAFHLYGGVTTFCAAAAFLLAQAMLNFSSQSCRAIVGFVTSEINRELTWRLVLLAVVVWGVIFHRMSSADFFCAGAVGMMLSLAFQGFAIRRRFLAQPVTPPAPFERSPWYKRSRSMWLSAVVEAASQYADVMIIGYFTSPAAAGEYFVAARFASILLMVSVGLHTYSLTHSTRLYFSGHIPQLQSILRSIACVALLMLLPAVLIIIAFGQQILTVFGQHYANVYPTLVVLTLATFVVSMCGPTSGILLTTGHERLYSKLITSAILVRLALTALLATQFGAMGAALGWAIVNAPFAIALAIVCRVVCGVDPSVAGLLHNGRTKRSGITRQASAGGALTLGAQREFTKP